MIGDGAGGRCELVQCGGKRRLPCRLRPGADDALDPRDQIDMRQTQLPLGIALEVYDANGLVGRRRVDVGAERGG